MQHVLSRLLPLFRLLLLLPLRVPRRPPRHPDTSVVVPRRGKGCGDTEGAGHQRGADLRDQQRQGPVPERAPAAARGQRQECVDAARLRDLRAVAARHLPLLLPRLQVGGDKEERGRLLRTEGGRPSQRQRCRRRRRRR